MNESLVPVCTLPTSDLVAYTKIFPSAFSTTSTNGRPSSATVSTKQKNSSQITASGSAEQRALVSSPPPKP